MKLLQRLNLDELIYDLIILISSILLHRYPNQLLVSKTSNVYLIIIFLLLFLFGALNIRLIDQTSSKTSLGLVGLLIIIPLNFLLGPLIGIGSYLYFNELGYINITNKFIEVLILTTITFLIIIGYIAGNNIIAGFYGLVLSIYITALIVYFTYVVLEDYKSYKLVNLILEIQAMRYLFAFPFAIVTAFLFIKLHDIFKNNIFLRSILERIQTLFQSNNSDVFLAIFSILGMLWSKLYYGIVQDQIHYPLGRFFYLFFSGVILLRIILFLYSTYKNS